MHLLNGMNLSNKTKNRTNRNSVTTIIQTPIIYIVYNSNIFQQSLQN